MLLGITGFEIRYQLRNPVFWVSGAVFFLLGFGITASENVSIGTPGGVHENAPSAIAIASSILTLFYLFVVTAFVANAIVRDDSSGFAPIVRATSVTAKQIVLGRFLGGLIIAWLGYLAVPLGMFAGSIMPWVDPETIGPQKIAYYAWAFWVFAVPDILLLCAVLFALATVLRSMMAAYIGAVALVMGYLVASSIIGQKIEYRDTFARFEPLGNAALSEAMRYWTQAELNSRLVEFSGALLFNRIFCVLLAVVFLAITLWRFTMTERAPSKRRLRRLAKRQSEHDRRQECHLDRARSADRVPDQRFRSGHRWLDDREHAPGVDPQFDAARHCFRRDGGESVADQRRCVVAGFAPRRAARQRSRDRLAGQGPLQCERAEG